MKGHLYGPPFAAYVMRVDVFFAGQLCVAKALPCDFVCVSVQRGINCTFSRD